MRKMYTHSGKVLNLMNLHKLCPVLSQSTKTSFSPNSLCNWTFKYKEL